MDVPSERAKHFEQQGGGGDAVHIVIAEDDKVFTALAGLEEPLYGGAHIREEERVRQLLEPGLEKGSDSGRIIKASIQEALDE